jgi:hypothetical protein
MDGTCPLDADKLPRAQAAWTAAQVRAQDLWEAKKAAGPAEGKPMHQPCTECLLGPGLCARYTAV